MLGHVMADGLFYPLHSDNAWSPLDNPEMKWYLSKVTINKVELAVRRDDDADVFVGFCPRFKVYSQGETSEEALDAVAGAVVLRIATAFEHGRLDKVLRQAGFNRLASGSAGRSRRPVEKSQSEQDETQSEAKP